MRLELNNSPQQGCSLSLQNCTRASLDNITVIVKREQLARHLIFVEGALDCPRQSRVGGTVRTVKIE